ncbi:hypothetical protein IQ07DRAFT_675438 [Pyrenochaeta sp. DS3sAY3a]|nr:hypothetical protein IQ07DRAFT_675438 [Pyrenochaeta sp. DS3sAY3a]
MATFLYSPITPNSSHMLPDRNATPRKDEARHFTPKLVDTRKESGDYSASAVTSPADIERAITNSRRSSIASSTKTQLRSSNEKLLGILQDIHTELATYRSIIYELQSRITHLERKTFDKPKSSVETIPLKVEEDIHLVDRSSNVTRESHKWWEACQNFAHNCDTPFSARAFLKTPGHYSGFDFDFDVRKFTPHTPTAPPEVDDVPSLTPASASDELSEDDAPAEKSVDTETTITKLEDRDSEAGSDIVERILDLDQLKMPPIPYLQSPPRSARSKSASVSPRSMDNNITALPKLPPPPPVAEKSHRNSKRIKSLFTYKISLRHKTSNKEYHSLIHFHRKSDLKIGEKKV